MLTSEVPEAREALERVTCLGLGSQFRKTVTITSSQKPSDIQALALLEILDPIREGAGWRPQTSSFPGSRPQDIPGAVSVSVGLVLQTITAM